MNNLEEEIKNEQIDVSVIYLFTKRFEYFERVLSAVCGAKVNVTLKHGSSAHVGYAMARAKGMGKLFLKHTRL